MADGAQRPRPPPNRRRDKPQLSCDSCRHRKLKCDRERPCGSCLKSGRTVSCKYATKSPVPDGQRSRTWRQSVNLNQRLAELENLVVTLIEDQSPRTPPSLASPSPGRQPLAPVSTESQGLQHIQEDVSSQPDPGTLKLRNAGTSYVQSVHWEAILAKIRGLMADPVTDSEPPYGSHLFYGPNRHSNADEILAAVPPRPVADRLMALHFDTAIVTTYIIHSKKFLREYEAFWTAPSSTPIAWIGLMFSMLYVATQLQTSPPGSSEGPAESVQAEIIGMGGLFREKAIQCLLLARYTAGGPYVLETLIMILTGEFILSKESGTDGWLLISTILKIAMRMGYHRDPDHFPSISPFEGEMRRRVWTTILVIDLSLSLEKGLPRNVTDTHIDTKEPRNLHDCDFDEETTTMPPSKAEAEWTPVLPLIARARLMKALGLICDANTDVNPPSHDDIVKIDALLDDVYTRAIPPILRWKTMPHPITDSPNLVLQRVSVQTTYYKARILLFRRALMSQPARKLQLRDRESVRVCVDSALQILSFQQMLHEESQPFGRLCLFRWKINHIFNQDVLLATSVLCLYLQDQGTLDTAFDTASTHNTKSSSSDKTEEIRQQLAISHKIWQQMSSSSPEARTVAGALSVVLGSSPRRSTATDPEFDIRAEINTMLSNSFGATFSNDFFPPGLDFPQTCFDDILDNRSS